MVVLGVVGGVASGKSLVTEQLRSLGAAVIDADAIGHEVLAEAAVKRALRQRWGDRVFDEAGEVNRREVARIVFAPPPAGPPELALLERLTHPRIGQRIRQQVARLRDQQQVPAVVLDAAVLFKAGWDGFCDKIVFVEAPHALRRQRARRRGWSDAQFAAREAAQEDLDQKRDRSHWVIDNSGSPEHTLAQVQQFWQTLG